MARMEPRAVDRLELLLAEARPVEPDVPFPQADTVKRILDLIVAVGEGVETAERLAERNDFTVRQSGYYVSAARYLGFVRPNTVTYRLTELGRQFVSAAPGARDLLFAQALVETRTFAAVATWVVEHRGRFPSIAEIAEIVLRECPDLSSTTVNRRAQTLNRWLVWLDSVLLPLAFPLPRPDHN